MKEKIINNWLVVRWRFSQKSRQIIVLQSKKDIKSPLEGGKLLFFKARKISNR